MKLALFKTSWGSESVLEEWADTHADYARLSDYAEIDFVPLPTEVIVTKQVASIEAQIDEITTESLEKINKLKQRKAELLALVAPS